MNVRDGLFDLLRRRGINRIFGNPGSTELPMLTGLPEDLSYVLCLHEHVAVAAALGFSALSGKPSLVNVHSLPGLAHASGAIATAAGNRVPVVVTAGQQDTRHLRTEPILSGPLIDFARPLVKWSHQPVRPQDVLAGFERAFRVATTPPQGPVFLSLPMDYFEGPSGDAVEVRDPVIDGHVARTTLQSLADDLSTARSVALVTGAAVETSGGWDAAIELAEQIDARVFTAPLASKLGFPTGNPRYGGQLLPEARSIHDKLAPYDLVLLAGGPGFVLYPYTDHPLLPPTTQAVLLTDAPEDAGRFECGSSIVCDVGAVLRALVGCVRPRRVKTHREVAANDTSVTAELGVIAVCREIRRLLADGLSLMDESVSNGPTLRSHLPIDRPNHYLRSSNAGLGSALPAAIGAAMADPECPVVVAIGDGSFMYSPQALWTMAQHGLNVKVVVLNNSRYQILRDLHASALAHLGRMVESELPGLDPTAIAAGFGVPSTTVSSTEELRPSLEKAFVARGPWLINVELTKDSATMFEPVPGS